MEIKNINGSNYLYKKDYTKNQFDLICKLFGIDPENTNSFVLREKAEIEVDYN